MRCNAQANPSRTTARPQLCYAGCTTTPPSVPHVSPLLSIPWPGWRHLPRDARDTLFLLGVIAWTVLPHSPNLPAWCVAFAVAVLLWRARLALLNAPLPGRAWLAAALLAAGVLTLWSHHTLLGKEAGVTMAVVLMSLKTLELRARRDAFVVFFLGFFLVLTHFLFSQTLITALLMLGSVWGLLTALVLAHMPAGRPALAQAGAQAARAALFGAPIMALLFVLFPRVGPLWGVPQEMIAKTGLSGSMTLGAMAEIADDESVALRLRFEDGQAPPAREMYFRGPVLTRFDGREWRASPTTTSLRAGGLGDGLSTRGAPVRYEMTIEPSRLPLLPLLDVSAQAPRIDNDPGNLRVRRGDDLVWTTQRPLVERLRVQATAFTDYRHGPRQAVASLREALELPAGHNPRTLQWAAALRRDPRYAEADARTLATAVLDHIRSGDFSYTLAPGTYGDNDPRGVVDEFWLDRKAGFCEHFAAGFVVVMRALGVPARIVTGYQGTDPLVVDGYHIVRQSHAHAWAEYWQSGAGWMRADPTAAVAPERIQLSRNLVPQRGFVAGAIGAVSPNLLAQWRRAWEAVNNRWNQWVLNYSRGQQLDLMQRLGLDAPSWQDLLVALLGAFSTLAALGAAWAWWDRHRLDPWTRLGLRVRARLHALGVDAPAHSGHRSMARHVLARHGDNARPLADWLLALDAQRYGRAARQQPSGAWWREFRRRAAAVPRR